MNEDKQPAQTFKLQVVDEVIEKLAHIKVHAILGEEECCENTSTDEWHVQYWKTLEQFRDALENYVQVRVFIALRKYVEENNKAA